MKAILIRTISGGVYTFLILGSIFWGPIAFGVLMFVFLLIGISEFNSIGEKAGSRLHKPILFILGSLFYILVFLYSTSYLEIYNLISILPLLFFPFILELFRKDTKLIINVGFGMLILVYVMVPFSLLNFLFYPGFDLSVPQVTFVLGFFIIAWTYDTFAYLSGMLLGKHKLFERISPKKTWEGTIGGSVFSTVAAYVFSLVYPEFSFLIWLGFALTIVIFGTFGDLVESLFKRSVGIKDSGALMPGHGGILDRMDSIMIAGPFALIYLGIVLR